jgi:preprotein translocase subunit SecD
MKYASVLLFVFLIFSVFGSCTIQNTSATSGIETTGGIRLVYQAALTNVSRSDLKVYLDSDMATINSRVESLGIKGAKIQALYDNQIQVDLPGVTETDINIELIGRSSILEFGEVTTDSDPLAKWTVGTQKWKPALGTLNGAQVPLNSGYFKGTVKITADPSDHLLLVFEWNSDGSILSKEITTRLYNNNNAQLGIFSGNDLLTAPSILGIITDKAQIEGLNQKEVVLLRDLLNAGRLQIPLLLVDKKIFASNK